MIYSPHFTAIIDACVLYPAPVRDILLSLADEKLYSPKWSKLIHEEWSRNLLKNRPDVKKKNIRATIKAMDNAFPDALVNGYETIINILKLPDPNDRHVLAAAIRCNADTIITENIKDFPKKYLKQFDVEVSTPDNFIISLYELNESIAIRAFEKQVARLKNPPLTKEQVLMSLSKCGLKKTSKIFS